MIAHFLGHIQKKIVIHDDTDANEQSNVQTVAVEDFVNTAPFHIDGSSKPGNTAALCLEFPFDHVAKMNGLVFHLCQILKIDTKIGFISIIQEIFKKYF